MSRRTLIGGGAITLEDVGGSFARFVKDAPKVMRQCVYDALDRTAFSLERHMSHMAPVGPDSPHLKETVSHKRRGLVAQVGYIEGQGGEEEARDLGDKWKGMLITNAWVALFNEYEPNKQPFMRPAAEREAPDFVKRMKAAIGQAERALGTTESLSGARTVVFSGRGLRRAAPGTGEGN